MFESVWHTEAKADLAGRELLHWRLCDKASPAIQVVLHVQAAILSEVWLDYHATRLIVVESIDTGDVMVLLSSEFDNPH